MSFQVFLTDDAARDLEDLYDYIDLHYVPGKADHVLEQIEKGFTSLSENPQRGRFSAGRVQAEFSFAARGLLPVCRSQQAFPQEPALRQV